MLTVVADADIFDTDSFTGEDRGNDGDSTWLVHHIGGEGVFRLYRSFWSFCKRIPVVSGGLKQLVDGSGLVVGQFFPQCRQGINVAIQHLSDIACVRHADLFPHDRRRGGNTGDILETSGSQPFHHLILAVAVVYQVDQAGGDEVRQMADRRDNEIMTMIIQHKGQRTDRICHIHHTVSVGSRRVRRRGNDIVRIFQQMVG